MLGVIGAASAFAGLPVRDAPPPPGVAAELAPSGELRAAINIGNVVLAKPVGEAGAQGVSVDIAREIGRRLKVPVRLVIYRTAGAVVDRQDEDRWDVAFMGIDAARARDIAFTAPYVVIEGTYMVRGDAPFTSVADLDRAGRTIAVGRGTAYDLYLSRTIRHATLVRFDDSNEAIRRFGTDHLDAVAGIRNALVVARAADPGLRVLPDSFTRIEQAVAVPRSRQAGARYVRAVIEEMKAGGFVRHALDRNGQVGVEVAPAGDARSMPTG